MYTHIYIYIFHLLKFSILKKNNNQLGGWGVCVGMQQSPEFAKELLRALRGGRDVKADIAKTELHDFWCRLTDPCYYSRIQIFFDM